MDLFETLFGIPSATLLAESKFTIAHGSRERLPEWLRTGKLESIDALASEYRGRLQIAHGGDERVRETPGGYIGEGGQTPVQGASARSLLRLGLTVFFQDLRDYIPATKAASKELEDALAIPSGSVSISAFVNAPGSGLPVHHDSHDQLLIHLIGTKNIAVGNPAHARHPALMYSPNVVPPLHFASVYRDGFLPTEEAVEDEGLVEHELRPGTCIFLPAGIWHRTSGQTEPCLSVSVAIRPPSRLDLLVTALTFLGTQSPELRAPAYGMLRDDVSWWSNEAAQKLLTRAAALQQTELRSSWLVRHLEDGVTENYPESLVADRYVRLPGSRFGFEDVDKERVRFSVSPLNALRPNVLEFDVEARALVESLAKIHRVFSLEEIAIAHPAFEPDEVALFLVDLARVGFLRPVPYPDLDPLGPH